MISPFKFQYFIWPEQGELLRLPIDWTNRRWPQYAGTEQRVLEVILENGAIHTLIGSLKLFKAAGEWDHRRDVLGAKAHLKLWATKAFPVTGLRPHRDIKRDAEEVAKLWWQPSASDHDRLLAHLTGEQRIPYAKSRQR